jgi:hypothetical protein
MLAETQDNEEIIARVAALDIGKAELVCCVRVPREDRPGGHLRTGLPAGAPAQVPAWSAGPRANRVDRCPRRIFPAAAAHGW